MQRIAGSLFGGLASKQKYSGGMKIFDMSKYIMSNLIRMCIYQQSCVLAFAEFIQTIVMRVEYLYIYVYVSVYVGG